MLGVLREMARTLKPGGRLGLLLTQRKHAPLFDTREELLRALAASGFESIRIEDHDDLYRVAHGAWSSSSWAQSGGFQRADQKSPASSKTPAVSVFAASKGRLKRPSRCRYT